jgi:hypothetical protein
VRSYRVCNPPLLLSSIPLSPLVPSRPAVLQFPRALATVSHRSFRHSISIVQFVVLYSASSFFAQSKAVNTSLTISFSFLAHLLAHVTPLSCSCALWFLARPQMSSDPNAKAGDDVEDGAGGGASESPTPLPAGVSASSVVTMSFLQSYLAEIVSALKTREKKKDAKRKAAFDAALQAQQKSRTH